VGAVQGPQGRSAAHPARSRPITTKEMMVICPNGCGAGDKIRAQRPVNCGGGSVVVIVPAGVSPGKPFRVDFEPGPNKSNGAKSDVVSKRGGRWEI
jgi:hypothetical protein